jgi:hypothetical protein
MALKSNVIDFKPAGIDQHGKKGGGSGADGMEARLAKLESDVGHIQSDMSEIKTDIRGITASIGTVKDDLHSAKIWMLCIFGGGFIALLVVFSGGYLRLSDNQEKLTSVMSEMRVSIQKLVDAVVPKKP